MIIEKRDLCTLVARALGVDELHVTEVSETGSPPEWDSLGHLKVCLAVEERFSVSLGLEEIAWATSIEKLKVALERT